MKPSEVFYEKTGRFGFYNIMPIDNVSSVLKNGILSNELVTTISHVSVAMPEIQSKRDKIEIPNGFKLHQYANLYFDARNPMMYRRRYEDICVLKISARILDLPNVVISDQNASSCYARFYEPDIAFDELDYDLIYARSWEDDDRFMYYKKKSAKCAEVLVPERVLPEFITAVAVMNEDDKKRLVSFGFEKTIRIERDLFFR